MLIIHFQYIICMWSRIGRDFLNFHLTQDSKFLVSLKPKMVVSLW